MAKYDELINRALDRLDTVHDDDTVNKIDYITTQLIDPARTTADKDHLAETLTAIIR